MFMAMISLSGKQKTQSCLTEALEGLVDTEEAATLEINSAAIDFIQVHMFNDSKFIPYDN